MRAILDLVSPAATLVEALEPIRSDPAHAAVLLDIDGTLAPIVRHAADAHVPEATRALLIEIAKPLRRRRLRQRPPRHHRPPDRRDRDDRLRRQPRRRAAAPRAIAARGRPRARGVDGAGATSSRDACSRPSVERLRVRSEDKDAIAAFHWRGAPDEEAAEAAVREIAERAAERRASPSTGAARCSRCARRSRSTRGSGSPALLRSVPGRARPLYVGDDTTDLDAFRGLRVARRVRRARERAVRRRQLRRSAARARARGRPDGRRARPACAGCSRRCCSAVRFVDFLRTTVLLSAGAATALGGRHGARAARRGLEQRCSCRSRSAGG